jgi:hypothetical protein
MTTKQIISAALELALFFKRLWVKSEKENYEQNRLKDESSAADAFERKFNPNGLRIDKELPSNDSDTSKGR